MSKTRMGKRVASLLLSLVMMLSLLPTTVYATEDTGGGTGETSGANVEATNTFDEGGTTSDPEAASEDEGGGAANVSEGEGESAVNEFNITAGNVEIAAADGETYTIIGGGTETANTAVVTLTSGTATVVLDNVNVTSDQSIGGVFVANVAAGAVLYLELDGTNVLKNNTTSYGSAAVLQKTGAGKLVICDDNAVAGSLDAEATGKTYGAAIGGSNYSDENGTIGSIEISGGTVTAVASYGAAIGTGGEHSIIDSIVISGGDVTATVSNARYGAAIGGGQYGEVTAIEITGGKVTATAGYGAGVGSGAGSTSTKSIVGTISITNGTVIAESCSGGAGIGGGSGKSATVNSIAISGGTITATSRTYQNTTGAAIGGAKGSVGSIAITAGDVTVQYRSGTIKPGTIGVSAGMAEGSTTIASGVVKNADADNMAQYIGDNEYDPTTGEIKPKATVVKPVSVNGTSYATLEDAIDAATPDANGVITYEISGKVDVTATGWVQVAKAGLIGLTAVKFVGTTDDAAIYVTKEDAVLADQVYGNVDVSFSGLTLVKENPTYLNDYAEFTQYFAMEIRATVKTGVVTYTDCKFPEGVINNTYGKTVFTGCEFSNDDSRYNLWVKEGEVELNNGAFTGTRGVKLYNTGNAKATITIKDTTFDGLTGKAAIVVSQPAPADVTLENVTARNCTVGLIQKDTATDATIIKANGESISGTFNITNAGNAKNEFNISAGTFTSEVSNDYCADGFEVKANDNGTYGVVNAATAAGDGTEANPYTLEQLGAMTRQQYIDAQERLNGTMYVTVGDYTYDTNGVLGNGVRDDTTGQTPDHSKLNAYGENGYLGEKNDGANGKSVVFVGGSITSGAKGYKDIDHIGTSLLLALPAYTKVTFKDTTFNNVMSFNYQLYTSPWSQLGELKFDGCTFNGIIVGAIAAQTLTFNRCEFTNYTNTTAPNSSNPTWIRPAYGNWAQSDNEGQGSDFRSLTTINFTNNTVTSTRPVKFEYISQWDITSTVTATGNFFDISSQAGDTAIKNVGLYLGAHTDANAFNLVAENNTKSANTAALYTIPEGETSLPLGSTVKNLAGEPVELTDALKWKAGDAATDKIVLKTVKAVASIGSKQYESLQAAIDAAAAGETVKLLKNATENVEIAKEKNLTLDLNGCILNGGTGTAKAALRNLGTITIQDTSAAKTGTIKRDDTGTVDETSYYVIRNQGTMTIESGIVTNNSGYRKTNPTGSMVGSSLICNGDCDEGGTLTIKGGTFTQNNFIAIKNGALGVLHVTGGTITSNHSAIQNWFKADITGGEIKGQLWTDAWKEGESVGATQIGGDAKFTGEIVMDITGSVAPTLAINGGNLSVTNWRITTAAAKAGAKPAVSGGTFTSEVPAEYCAEGFIPTANTDGTFGVKAGAYVAQIGDVKYESLQAAIDAVKANETIYVLGNVDLGTDKLSTYDVKTTVKNVTIDLDGYTVTSAGKYTVYLKVNGWTIQNGTIQNTNASTTYGTLYIGGSYNSTTLKNLTVESETNGVYFAIASNKNGIKASITVEDGTKISGKYGVYMKGQPKPYGYTRDGQEILNVNGGEITGTTAAIAVFGAAKGNTKAGVIVNINGGKVYSDSYAIAGNGSPVLENTTINISGGKVFSNKDTAIYHPQAGTVTISGGEVYGVTGGVQMCAGTLNVTDGTISATGNGDVSGKTGDGSIPDGAAVSIVNRAYPAGAPTMTISGGTFTSAKGVGAVQAYGWSSNSQQTWDEPNASVSGGTFSSAVPAEYCAGGFIPTDNGDGTYGVKEGVYVAQIGETTYETLAEAFAAAKDGDTITLLTDCSGNGIVVKAGTFTDKGLIVDFAGYSYTVGGVLVGSSGTKSNGFQLNKNNKITFQNGAIYGDASVAGDDMTNWTGAPAILIQNYCDLTLSGMKVSGGSNTVYTLSNNCGDVVIENTTINAGGGGSGYAPFALDACGYTGYTGVSVTVKGTSAINGDIEVSRSANNENAVTLTLESGTVTGALTIDSSIEKSKATTTVTKSANVTLAAPDGYLWNADGKLVVAVAQVGETTYETLEAAFAAAKDGDTITLLRDCQSGRINLETKSITVDLNGKVLTSTAAYGVMFCAKNGHQITVKGTTAGSKLVGTLMVTAETDGRIEINGGIYESAQYCPIYINGAVNTDNSTLTVKNATITALPGDSDQDNGVAVYLAGYSTSTFTNTTITAPVTGLEIRAGKLTLTDCTVTGGSGEVVTNANGNGTTVTNAAVAISQHTTKKDIDVTITGGTYTAKAAVYQTNVQGTGSENVTVSIKSGMFKGAVSAETNNTVAVSGGTFSSAVKEEYCATGYIPTANADGTYGVKEGVYVAKVDNVKYETLQEAINAAKGGSTVRLLANVTLTETAVFPAGKTVHLNLVGHNITATGTALRINGKTDIQDTDKTGIIESTGNVAVAVGNNAKVTVYSGTLKGREGAVITGTSTGATIEIRGSSTKLIATDNAVIAGNGSSRTGNPNTILVKGGTFIGGIESTGYIACGIYAPWNDNVTVSGGTFNITNGAGIVARAGTVKVTGGTFNCGDGTAKGWVGDSKNMVPCAALVFDEAANYPALTADSKILVSGGSFSTDPAANGATLAAGYAATKDESGMYKVAKENPAAEINGVKYDTLQAAINAAQATKGGATITLLKNINTQSYYTVNGDNPVTIDLAGYNITGSGISGLFYVPVKGDLTIKGEGTVTAVEDNGAAMVVWVRSSFAKVTLEGGTYTQQISNTTDPHFDLIYVERGNVYVKGGTYKGATPDWTLNCKDGNYPDEANIEVTGGTFVGFDPANNKAEGEGTSFVPAGYVSTKGADGNFVVTEVKVAEVNGVAYATLSEAIAAANAGDTVKLLRDINTPEISYMISKSLTIDLNGMTVTGSGYDAVFQIDNADAKVVIKNGKVVAVEQSGSAGKYTMAIWASKAGCEVTLEGLDVSQKITHTDDPQMDMIYASGGTITINSGNFVSGTPAWTLNCNDTSYKNGTANIIVKGGTFANFDPANNEAEDKGTNFVAAGYVSNMDEDGSYTVVPADASIKVNKRLTIGNDLTMTYLVTLSNCADARVKFQFYNDDIKDYTEVMVENGTKEADGRFAFDFTGINPQRMTDTLKATVYATDVSGGTIEYQVDDYSVAQYCINTLKKSTTTDSVKKLIGNLVAYGAAAQVYKNYREDNLVSSIVTGVESTDYVATELSKVTSYGNITKGTAGINIVSKTLVLSNTFAVRVYFTLDEGIDIGNVRFKVTANNKVNEVDSFQKDSKGRWYFDYAKLNATQLDSKVTFESFVVGTEGDTAGDTLEYSVNTYLAKMMPQCDKSSDLYKFMAELFNYGCACKEFE